MNIVTNNNFIEIRQLIEQINEKCSLELGLDAKAHVSISVNEFGALSLLFCIKYKKEYHSVGYNINPIEFRFKNYDINKNLSNFIKTIAKTLKKSILKD